MKKTYINKFVTISVVCMVFVIAIFSFIATTNTANACDWGDCYYDDYGYDYGGYYEYSGGDFNYYPGDYGYSDYGYPDYEYYDYGYSDYGYSDYGYSDPGYYTGGSAYIYVDTPSYTYTPTYPLYPPAQPSPLSVSCYPNYSSIQAGNSVTWYSSISGGTGNYHVTWSGTDGLSGQGQTALKSYSQSGVKNASVVVTSGGQSRTANCQSLTVYPSQTYYQPTPPVYYPPTYQYPVSVSCYANVTSANVGSSVTWTATASGGQGAYNYTWYGTDGLYGSGQTAYRTYNTPGTKTASVTVTSGGSSASAVCSNSVSIIQQVAQYVQPIVQPYVQPVITTYRGASNELDIGCFVDPATSRVNQPVTWTAEVVGGIGPYTYTWSGSDNLTGSASSITKYYSTIGEKNAIVTIRSADGKSGTRACSNTASVRGVTSGGTGTTGQTPAQTTDTDTDTDNSLAAASIFSLGNVPWGWIAILIILILFATVLYLLFNKQKI